MIGSCLEQRISKNVSQLLDKLVTVELHRIKKDFNSNMEPFKNPLKAEVALDINDIRTI